MHRERQVGRGEFEIHFYPAAVLAAPLNLSSVVNFNVSRTTR